MNHKTLALLGFGVLWVASFPAQALLLRWADISGGTVPGTTIGYTLVSTSDGNLFWGAGDTNDGDHSWSAGGTLLRQTGGNWTATISFDAPVPASSLTFTFSDVDTAGVLVTLSVTGLADTQDFVIDPGFSYRPDFLYDGLTGELTSPSGVLDNSSQLFGNSSATIVSMTLQTSGIPQGDYTDALFGFVVPTSPGNAPEPATLALLGLGLAGLGFARRRRA